MARSATPLPSMNTATPAFRASAFPDDAALPPLRWPPPPYLTYGGNDRLVSPQPCTVEGFTGQTRSCFLVSLDTEAGNAYILATAGRAPIPLRFDTFRCLTLTDPLAPVTPTDTQPPDSAFDELVRYRPRLPYRLTLADGSTREGTTIGHLKTDAGVFLYEPIDDNDHVRRLFFPRSAWRDLQIGEAIGRVLVEQHAVSADQVEIAAKEQEALRQRKLGDYLVDQEIIKPEQLLAALEEQRRMPLVRIGEALTALGYITPAQLQEALERQKTERNLPLGELLVQSGLITREQLRIALARKMGYPVVDLARFPIDVEALRRVPLATARKLRIVPLLWRTGALILAAEDPSQRAMVDELEFLLQCKVLPTLSSQSLDAQAVSEAYGRVGLDANTPRSPEIANNAHTPPDLLLESLELDAQDSEDDSPPVEQSDNSLVRLINGIIIEAHRRGASDIHIETHPGKRKVRVRLRKDGRMQPYMELPHTYRAALVARIKIMCELDISERRKPQDGKIDFARFSPQHPIELRVATIPTYGGAEDVVMRILASARALPIQDLGLSPENLQQLLPAMERPHGMVLCVGPTGSGKTTTLHALLQHINTPDRKIWTAEDPIEIANPDLRQIQVNPRIDWTFAKALRALLRADPDVIMVGEIRDTETAQMAIEASLTGHLVLSTLHTNSAAETVVRLLDMGMDPFNFADSLVGVLAQRLVRRLCAKCARHEVSDAAYVEELLSDYLHVFPAEVRPDPDRVRLEWLERFGQSGTLKRPQPVGCDACDHTGYKGRVGIHELLMVDAPLRRLIQTKSPPEALERSAIATGYFRTLRQDGILKVLQGLTTIDEIRANTAH
jgi:type II secretory ATPase GspE/PulE/Tfp pilus assembly ATPase PilB-like protein